jgi:predicted nucleic acid-binding protein
MATLVVVDAGPFVAWASRDDVFHTGSVRTFVNPSLQFVVPSMVIAEACYMVGTRLGPSAEVALLSASRVPN